MENNLNGRWDATAFFESLCATNRLAQTEGFTFCRVSGLEGFEEAVNQMQNTNAFCCVSDIADGYTDLNNTPRTRRVKTVFFAMRHGADDMDARTECMEIMRELFRQFMTRLILEKVRLEQNCIYLDPRISFNEIDRYFFSGCAAAYFQIAVDVFTDLRHNPDEWTGDYDQYFNYFDLYVIETTGDADAIRELHNNLNTGLAVAKDILHSEMPAIVLSKIESSRRYELNPIVSSFVYSKLVLVKHGEQPGAGA